jgi:hypothetical protein
LFGFDIRHNNNNYALHRKRDVVPCRIVLHENTGEQRNELEKYDEFEHFLVEFDDLTLELVIDNLSESRLFIEVIVGLINDIRNEMDQFSFGQIWLFDVFAHRDFILG